MPFILSVQRDTNCSEAFRGYREYLKTVQEVFPRGGYTLACANWYFDHRDHRCPHDAWMESFTVSEPSTGARDELRFTAIRLRLLGAYHDGFIEFFYPRVFSYSLISSACDQGLGDWRYDEFRVSPAGRLIHEIEWGGFPAQESARWLIEAEDVEFRWIPKT
ncbi:MAG: hypothetical protein EBS05_20270 [Proteobacteria bacterium]|nr:hypothetical protein [Pseudomonadota bacterium]